MAPVHQTPSLIGRVALADEPIDGLSRLRWVTVANLVLDDLQDDPSEF